ncbi:hypothetical protein Gotur_004614 [Gossypium turneri]
MINLLDLICPMKESPNVIYALHLIELMARDSLVFIAHHKHETNATVGSSFEDILTFYQYEQNNWGLVTEMVVNGSVKEENNVARNVNCSVLDRAPFSIGILIDRGKDDREAVMLAKRMAQDPRVKLTVIWLIAYQDHRDVLD